MTKQSNIAKHSIQLTPTTLMAGSLA